MNYSARYVLNPNYRLLDDVKRSLIIAVDKDDEIQSIKYTEGIIARIHPLHAQILSFFDGEKTYEEVLSQLEKYLYLDRESIEEYCHKLIKNENSFHLHLKEVITNFPVNVLVNVDLCPVFKKYSYKDFPLVADIDLTSRRLYKPRYFSIILNTYCYTDCIYCYADRKTKVSTCLSTKRIFELIDEMVDIGAINIDFNGGEVLMHPDCLEILAYSMSKGFQPYISTKCPLSYELVQGIKRIGLKKIQISLDSTDSNVLGYLLKTKSNYYKAMQETISYLEEAGIEVIIHCILTRYNSSKENAEQLVADLSLFNNINCINFDVAGYSLYKKKESFGSLKITEKELKNLQDVVKELAKKYPNKTLHVNGTTMLCRIFSDKILRDKEFQNRPLCEGNLSYMLVLPDGKVTICEELYWHPQFILGNITEKSIMEVWMSDKALALHHLSRKDISEKSACKICGDFNLCRGENGSRVCWKTVQYFYGSGNWDFPEPSCPFAPPAINDCLHDIE